MANDDMKTTEPTGDQPPADQPVPSEAAAPSEPVARKGPVALSHLLTSTEMVTETGEPSLGPGDVLSVLPPVEDVPQATTLLAGVPMAAEAKVDWAARQARWMSLVVLAVLVAVGVVLLGFRATRPVDLAAGKPWSASSKWIDCDPNVGRCGPHVTLILFHTNEEENPWFEIDLQTPTAFSGVTVVNRSDHMPERAVPLILEVSDDRLQWKELARRDELFSRWSPKIEKTTSRYVRVRVPRRTYLHLEGMQIHP